MLVVESTNDVDRLFSSLTKKLKNKINVQEELPTEKIKRSTKKTPHAVRHYVSYQGTINPQQEIDFENDIQNPDFQKLKAFLKENYFTYKVRKRISNETIKTGKTFMKVIEPDFDKENMKP